MKTQHYPTRRLLLGSLILSAAALYSYQAQAAGQLPIPNGVAMTTWHENGADGKYLLQMLEGKTPKAGKAIVGTVVSDTDCEADAEGLSHCHNAIKLADGSKITVIDTHEMHRNRCLGDGDKISLTTVDKGWVMGTLFKK